MGLYCPLSGKSISNGALRTQRDLTMSGQHMSFSLRNLRHLRIETLRIEPQVTVQPDAIERG
jgi:hypothetical protein